MAALVLTFFGALFIGGGLWFALGSRFEFDADPERNELKNFIALVVASIPVSFVLVFFGLG